MSHKNISGLDGQNGQHVFRDVASEVFKNAIDIVKRQIRWRRLKGGHFNVW